MKAEIKTAISNFVHNFGFENISDFYQSIFHKNLLLLTIPLTSIIAVVGKMLGLESMTIGAFVLVLGLELGTGIAAAIVKKEPITSRKFSRFGLKAFIWLCFLFIINAFRLQYKGVSYTAFEFWDWLHFIFLSYITLEYLISIDENITTITGKKTGVTSFLQTAFSKLESKKGKEDGKQE